MDEDEINSIQRRLKESKIGKHLETEALGYVGGVVVLLALASLLLWLGILQV